MQHTTRGHTSLLGLITMKFCVSSFFFSFRQYKELQQSLQPALVSGHHGAVLSSVIPHVARPQPSQHGQPAARACGILLFWFCCATPDSVPRQQPVFAGTLSSPRVPSTCRAAPRTSSSPGQDHPMAASAATAAGAAGVGLAEEEEVDRQSPLGTAALPPTQPHPHSKGKRRRRDTAANGEKFSCSVCDKVRAESPKHTGGRAGLRRGALALAGWQAGDRPDAPRSSWDETQAAGPPAGHPGAPPALVRAARGQAGAAGSGSWAVCAGSGARQRRLLPAGGEGRGVRDQTLALCAHC